MCVAAQPGPQQEVQRVGAEGIVGWDELAVPKGLTPPISSSCADFLIL